MWYRNLSHYLLEYAAICKFEMLPLTSIYDGVVFASPVSLTTNELHEFNIGFAEYVEEKLGVSLPLETEPVGSAF